MRSGPLGRSDPWPGRQIHGATAILNVAILISGGGSNMQRLLEDMVEPHPGHARLVLSNRPEAGGQAKAQAQAMGVATRGFGPPAFWWRPGPV